MLNIILASLVLPLVIQFFLLIFSPSFILYWGVFLGLLFLLFKYFPIHKKTFAIESIIFLALFSFLYLVGQKWIYFHPSGEHIRDYSLLSASIANPLNPKEPWMSYEPNHYYIYWYKWGASLSYLFHLNGEQTYVLSLCLSFALYIGLCFFFLHRMMKIEKTKAFGLSLLPAFLSNFDGILSIFRENFHWWSPSRVINGAITEFPMWTFLQGDYHPHFPSLILSVLFLYLSFAAIKLNAPRYNRLVYLSLVFVLFYRVYMIANPWDVIFLAISFGGILLKEFLFENPKEFQLSRPQNLVLLLLGFLILSSTFLYPPLIQTNIKFAMVTKEVGRSTLKELLSHWGLWIISLVMILIASLKGKRFKSFDHNILYFFILSFLLILIPEIVFVDDPYGPPNERMNFIFKMYMPAWTMMGIFVCIISEKSFSPRMFWAFFLSIFIIGNIFNFKIVPQRINEYSQYENRLDYADREHPGIKNLILKFREFKRDTTVQSAKSAYDYTSFIGTMANKDLYLGWINHMLLFVPDYSILMNRQSMIKAIYEEMDCLRKKQYLDQIGAQYLIFSMQEKKDYPASMSTDFSCLKTIISEGDNFIYQTN
jgi:uncharacterized membrane protein